MERARSPWIWSRRADVGVFGGSAALALILAALGARLAPDGTVPGWAWLAFVLGVDVAHVHATLYRTYLDREELARRPRLYTLLPIACFALGVILHLAGELVFWRALAYLAVFHFVRQQAGWVAIYRAKNGERDRTGARLDAAVVYASTLYPLAYWHTHLPRAFRGFVDGDFVSLGALAPIVPWLGALEVVLLAAYAGREIGRAASGARTSFGKHLVVASTAATWYVGIALLDGDFTFTVCNVIVHGVPYLALLWAYTKARGAESPGTAVARVAALGLGAFVASLVVCAYDEQLARDRLVWHEAPPWFGGLARSSPLLSPIARAFVVPLLAVPQATHYALDAVLWRRRDTGPSQARALGFHTP